MQSLELIVEMSLMRFLRTTDNEKPVSQTAINLVQQIGAWSQAHLMTRTDFLAGAAI
jgi:hypothetical protein